MLNGVELPIVGNITRDPELQFSGQGKAWVRFSVAVNRVTNRDGQKQEKVTFVNCKAFGEFAENIAASLKRGMRVVAYGRFEEESWTAQDGQERKAMSFFVDDIGPSLRWAQTPTVEKVSGGGSRSGGNGGQGGYSGPPSGGQGGGQGGGFDAPDAGLSSPGTDDNPFF